MPDERLAIVTLIDGSKWEAVIDFYKEGTPVLRDNEYGVSPFIRARTVGTHKVWGWIRKEAIISIDAPRILND